MRRFVSTAVSFAVLLIAAPITHAQYNTYDYRDGKQRITEFVRVFPPKTIKGAFPDATAQGTVLQAQSWPSGNVFTDEKGWNWRRIVGPLLNQKPKHVAGWLIQTKSKQTIFMSVEGTMYCRLGLAAPRFPPGKGGDKGPKGAPKK